MTHDHPLDVLVLLALFVVVFLLAAIFSPRGLIAWAREEWRLFKLDTWDDGKYDAPRTAPAPRPVERGDGTRSDPKVQKMEERQRAFGERLREQGRSLLAGKEYVPALTRGFEPPIPRANKVVPIRRAVPTSPRKESL